MKLTEQEYNEIAGALACALHSGDLARNDYTRLLARLSGFREVTKPEVRICEVSYSKYGNSEVAHGFALDHPRIGAQYVNTSLVVSKDPDGKFFETLNTRYVIVPDSEKNKDTVSDRPRSLVI